MKRSFRTKAMTFFLFTALTLYSGLDRNNSFGWLAQNVSVPENTNGGAIGSYFGGGDGTEANPYLIKTPRHLYNLAWLQDIGIFNQKTETDSDGNKRIKPTYFKIDSTEIDMTNFALPPIGTTKYPFISHLEGNNGVIKNLHVTDDFSQLTHHPYTIDAHKDTYVDSSTDILKNCEIIGAFGVIGLYNYNKEITLPDGEDFSTYTVSSSAISVSDVYYDNLTIEPKASKTLAGLLAGYVAGSLTTSGVYRGNISFKAAQTSISSEPLSHYTLVGDFDKSNASWEDKPGMKGWGNSIDIKTLFEREDLIYKAGSKSTIKNFYNQFYGMTGWEKATEGKSYQPKGTNMYLPLRVSNNIAPSFYTSTMTRGETIDQDNNSGYLAGDKDTGGSKFQFNKDLIGNVLTTNGNDKTSGTGVTWSNGKVTDINLWTKRNNDSNTQNVEKAETVYSTLLGDASRVSVVKQQIIDSLNEEIASKDSPTDADLSIYSLQFTGNKPDQNQSICIPKAYIFGKEYTNFYMPCRTLSFTAFSDGFICLVGFNTDRDWASILNIYTHEITSTNNVVPLTPIPAVTYNNNLVFSSSWGQLPRGKMMFYQIPIKAGEHYAIGAPNNSDGMRILYLDLGLNGSQSESKTNKLENLDFVYTDSSGKIVKIGSSGTASSTYVFSKVLFKLEVSSALNQVVLYIKRTKGTSDDKVNYYASDSTLAVTIIGTQANTSKASDNSFYTAA